MARFVRLAEQSEVDAEHLHAPVVIKGPSGTPQLGYLPARQEGIAADGGAGRILVSASAPRTLGRPIVEGGLGIVLLLVLLGSLTDMGASKAPRTMIGAVVMAVLAFVGFQGVRTTAKSLLMVYAIGTAGLLFAGFVFGVAGIVPRAPLHAAGVALALLAVQAAAPRRFLV